jgi:hypothetical protein
MTFGRADAIAQNLARVRDRIAEAAARSQRTADSVAIVAVSKTFPAEDVVAAWHAGVRQFGENRVEEAMAKIPEVEAALGGLRPVWHMVGHLQSRKANDAARIFDCVHSVDRLKIARRLSRFAQEGDRNVTVLLECNVSGEESKFGFPVAAWRQREGQRAAFMSAVTDILAMPRISICGLMTMAPLVEDPESVRPIFASLRELLHALVEWFPGTDWCELSMGMTDDFEVAIEEGATMVRVGRAIFGAR